VVVTLTFKQVRYRAASSQKVPALKLGDRYLRSLYVAHQAVATALYALHICATYCRISISARAAWHVALLVVHPSAPCIMTPGPCSACCQGSQQDSCKGEGSCIYRVSFACRLLKLRGCLNSWRMPSTYFLCVTQGGQLLLAVVAHGVCIPDSSTCQGAGLLEIISVAGSLLESVNMNMLRLHRHQH
jgi:hypothetical protein